MSDHYRRHYPRSANPPVRLEIPGDRGAVLVAVRDLSAGGVRVSVAHTIPVGSELDVRLAGIDGGGAAGTSSAGTSFADTSLSGTSLALRARVLRIQRVHGETDLALEFIDRVESTSSRLQALVDTLLGGRARAAPATRVEERRASGEGASAAGGGTAPAVSSPARSQELSSAREPGREAGGPPASGRSELERALAVQVERAERAEAALRRVGAQHAEERERRRAAERTLVTLQRELAQARASRGDDRDDRLRRDGDPQPDSDQTDDDGLLGDRPGRNEPVGAGSVSDQPVSGESVPDESAADEAVPDESVSDEWEADEPVPSERRAAGDTIVLGPSEVTSRVVFARILREGGRLRPTERFARFEPVSRLDVRIHDWAKRESELAGIRRLAGRRVGEDDLIRVLYTFFERGLLGIEPAGRGGTGGGR